MNRIAKYVLTGLCALMAILSFLLWQFFKMAHWPGQFYLLLFGLVFSVAFLMFAFVVKPRE